MKGKPKADTENKGVYSCLGLAAPEGQTQAMVGSDLLWCLLVPLYQYLAWKEVAEVLHQSFLYSDNQEHKAITRRGFFRAAASSSGIPRYHYRGMLLLDAWQHQTTAANTQPLTCTWSSCCHTHNVRSLQVKETKRGENLAAARERFCARGKRQSPHRTPSPHEQYFITGDDYIEMGMEI